MFIVKYRKIFYAISVLLVVASIASLSIWGLKLGIDFKGGTSITFQYPTERPSIEAVKGKIDTLQVSPAISGTYSLVPYGPTGYVLKTRNLSEPERALIMGAIQSNTAEKVEFKKVNTIGPTLGKTSANKALVSVVLVLICIVLFITFAFRKVSKPVSSWKYGLVSVLALSHDVIIPMGLFAVLGHYLGYEVDTLFVTAILVILGFSIHDTIVVFDRTRENLKNNRGDKSAKSFETIVGESINQTFTRSLNTSLTTLLAILMVFLFGPEATKNFSLVLLVGVFFGTYSSIFIASNLLVTIEKFQKKA
ncbi:MAG: protein translocase subunit SecF [Candidatus Paceibacterota bacterium]